MNRSLSRRLEFLEAQMTPSRIPHIITIEYVDPTGEVVGSCVVVGDLLIRDRKRQGRRSSNGAGAPAGVTAYTAALELHCPARQN